MTRGHATSCRIFSRILLAVTLSSPTAVRSQQESSRSDVRALDVGAVQALRESSPVALNGAMMQDDAVIRRAGRRLTFNVAVAKAGSGTGTVTSSPAGINCGATCSANFTLGTVVTLGFQLNTNSFFAGWSGDCSGIACTLSVTQNRSVTATFNVVTTALNKIAFWQHDLPCPTMCDHIWKMNPDGTGAVQLTTDEAQTLEPGWNPDHTKIAFVRELAEGSIIFVMNADGSAQTKIQNGLNYSRAPAWSPDGAKIAFIGRFGDELGLAVMNADGTNVAQLSHEPCSGSCLAPGFPTWSADGTKIAYGTPRDGNYEIYVVDVATGTAVNITNHPASDAVPAWSPDGTKIAFASNRENPDVFSIFKMNADGSNPIRVGGPGYDPAWSPDGTKLVYGTFSSTLTIRNADGSQTDLPGPALRGDPAWK